MYNSPNQPIWLTNSSVELDSAFFPSETRQAVAKLLAMTSDPKSAEIRRCSQKAVIGLFDLNPATFTLMLRSVSKPLQESANRILRGYMQVSVRAPPLPPSLSPSPSPPPPFPLPSPWITSVIGSAVKLQIVPSQRLFSEAAIYNLGQGSLLRLKYQNEWICVYIRHVKKLICAVYSVSKA